MVAAVSILYESGTGEGERSVCYSFRDVGRAERFYEWLKVMCEHEELVDREAATPRESSLIERWQAEEAQEHGGGQ